MRFFLKDANERELEKMSEFVSVIFEEKEAKKKDDIIQAQACNPHQWEIAHRSTHKIVRVCNLCDKERYAYYTNEMLRQIEANIKDYAQPGSILYEKIYGKTQKNTTE